MMKSAIVLTLNGILEKVIVGADNYDVIAAAALRMAEDGKANLDADMKETMRVHGYYEYNGNDGKVTLQLTEAEQANLTIGRTPPK